MNEFKIYVNGKEVDKIKTGRGMRMIYAGICSFYMPSTVVTIENVVTKEKHNYIRQLDKDGNIMNFFEDGKEIR